MRRKGVPGQRPSRSSRRPWPRAPRTGCIVVVKTTGEANVRWANNTVTTNGVARTTELVRGRRRPAAPPAPLPRRPRPPNSAAVDRRRGACSRGRSPSVRRMPARPGMRSRSSTAAPTTRSHFPPRARRSTVYTGLIEGLAEAFDDARGGNRILYGFARHELTTTYLGTSTGLRRRWVQPTGTLEVNAKSADLTRSSWAGQSTADFTDVDVLARPAVAGRPAGLVAAADRPAARSLRHGAATDLGRRLHDARCLGCGRPGRAPRAARRSRSPVAAPGSASG